MEFRLRSQTNQKDSILNKKKKQQHLNTIDVDLINNE